MQQQHPAPRPPPPMQQLQRPAAVGTMATSQRPPLLSGLQRSAVFRAGGGLVTGQQPPGIGNDVPGLSVPVRRSGFAPPLFAPPAFIPGLDGEQLPGLGDDEPPPPPQTQRAPQPRQQHAKQQEPAKPNASAGGPQQVPSCCALSVFPRICFNQPQSQSSKEIKDEL